MGPLDMGPPLQDSLISYCGVSMEKAEGCSAGAPKYRAQSRGQIL